MLLLLSYLKNKISFLILPFNLVVKSETADFMLLNSVLAEAKFVVVVSKLFKMADPYHSIIFFKKIHVYLSINFTSQFFSQIFFDGF